MKFLDLNEGPNDPGIFKAIFLAGGPGSGKSYIANQLALKAAGLRSINSDEAYEYLMRKHELDMGDPEQVGSDRGQELRNRAKVLTMLKQNQALDGRLGVVIDGTAKDPEKIAKMKAKLEELGYETAMVFVNTSLRTAMTRNRNRQRTVPTDLLVANHKAVQKGVTSLAGIFGDNFIEINNDDPIAAAAGLKNASKHINRFLGNPLNSIAKDWLNKQRLGEEMGDPIDTLDMDIPLFVRILELSRETIKTDAELHHVVSKIIELSKEKETLDMDDYDAIEAVVGTDKVDEVIRKVKGGYRLYSKKGKNLGTFDTKAGAEKHEREVQYFKHMGEDEHMKFAHHSDVDVPRKDMPQIGLKHLQDAYRLVKGKLALSKIKPSQSQRVPGMVQSVIDDMLSGKMKQKPLVVDKHGYLVNGHHRLDALKHIAKDYNNGDMKVSVIMVDATLQDLIDDFSHTASPAFAEEVEENFKDGKNPGRKGLAKRMGVDCSKSETELRKIAKNSTGEKQRMAHWCANMKGGKK